MSNVKRALPWLRRMAGALALAGFVVLFLGLEWRFVSWLAPIVKLQFMPAVLAFNVAVAVTVLAVTILTGRLYCSVLCPLGLMQDAAGRVGRMLRKVFRRPPRGPAAPSRVHAIVRYSVLGAFLAAGICGLGFSWIEPYGIFGRAFAAFDGVDAGFAFSTSFMAWSGLALAALIVLLAMSGRGRAWCSWICPVGTLLGFVSRLSPFRIGIDSNACVGCRRCERGCKTGAIAIEGRGGKVDVSLCVDCFNCLPECPTGAVKFGLKGASAAAQPGNGGTSGMTRKGFMAGTAVAGLAMAARAAEDKIFDGGFAETTPPGIDVRNASLKPAGAHSIANFTTRCVGCQLCVKACPNHVLRPSLRLKDFMQPEMAFDRGFCTVDCSRCADVCPAGAIEPLGGLRRENVQIGLATWHKDRCLAAAEGVMCTACERHCPVKAITLVKTDDGGRVPVVDELKCIGCGACEHVCPARPLPGLTVKAYEQHREVRAKNSADALAEARELGAECGPCGIPWLRPMDS